MPIRTAWTSTSSSRVPQPIRRWSASAIVVAGVVTAIAGYISVAVGQTSDRKAVVPTTQGGIQVRDSQESKLPPLPDPDYKVYPMDVMRPVYHFVAQHADLVRYVPCFCVCGQRYGHRSLEDCYIRNRPPGGSVTWSDHSMGCMICIDVGRRVKTMYERGTPLDVIRHEIEEAFAASKHRTPTPWPPKAVFGFPHTPIDGSVAGVGDQ
jgi:hypothetical protein